MSKGGARVGCGGCGGGGKEGGGKMLHRGAQEGIGGLWHTVATFGALEQCQNDSQRAGEHAEGSGWVWG